jgi:hypothetical protein
MKTCKDCCETKSLEEFYRHKGCKDGRSYVCKKCSSIREHARYLKSEAYLKAKRHNEKYATDEERIEATRNRSRETARRKRERANSDPELMKKLAAQWKKHRKKYKSCPEKNARRRVRERERFNTDPQFRVLKTCRSRMAVALRKNLKSANTMGLIGCTGKELAQYLESMFKPGMSWNNHGKKWHIDHVAPCSSFNLADPEEQKRCFHYTNLRPMWAVENIKKGDSLGHAHQPELMGIA